ALRLVEGIVDGEFDALAALIADLDGALGRLGALLLGARVLLGLGLKLKRAGAALGDLLDALGRLGDLDLLARPLLGLNGYFLRLLRRWRLGDNGLRYRRSWRHLHLLHGLGLGTQRLQALALALLGLGPFLGRFKRAAARVELVGPQGTGLLDRLRQQTIGFGLQRACFVSLCGTWAGDRALFLLLHDHRLRATVAEVLAHVARLHRALQAQRLARDRPTQGLVCGLFRLGHARPVLSWLLSVDC